MHRGLAAFQALEPRWRHLTDGDPRYWMAYAWNVEQLRYGTPSPDAVTTLSIDDSAGDPVAILPLIPLREPLRRLPIAIWALPGGRPGDVADAASGADFACRSPAEAPAALRAALAHLSATRPHGSLLHLGRVAEGANAHVAAMASPRRVVETRQGWSAIATDVPHEQLLARLGDRFRRSLRSTLKKAGDIGAVSTTIVRAGEPGYDDAYRAFLAVEASGWKGQAGTNSSLATNPVTLQRDFLEAIAAHRDDHRVEIAVLRVGDQPVATHLSLRRHRTLAVLKCAYDEAWRHLQPGHLLMAQVAERCCADDGIDEIDLVSRTAWHDQWKARVRNHHTFYLPVGGVRGTLAMALLRLPTVSALRRSARLGSGIGNKEA